MTRNLNTDNPLRQALPKRWPPILLYAAILLALIFTSNIDQPAFYRGDGRFNPGDFYWTGFAVLVALIAMLQIKIRYRLACLLALELFRLFVKLRITAADEVVFSTIPDLIKAVGNQLAIDLVEFGLLSTLAHLISGLFRVHVAAGAPSPSRAGNSSIAVWLYFISIIGLICLPQPGRIDSASHMTWEPFNWRNLLRLLSGPQSQIVLLLIGLLCLIHFRRIWRFAIVLVLLIIAVEIMPFWELLRRSLRSGEWSNLLYFFIDLLQSIPFWLLLRWAGYRLYSPRRWIDSQASNLNQFNLNAGAAPALSGVNHPFQ